MIFLSFQKEPSPFIAWKVSPLDEMDIIDKLLFINLWGNQADLSLWPAEEIEKPDHKDQEEAARYLLVNESKAVLEILDKKNIKRLDFLIDNAGFELITDLIFSDYLLSSGMIASVCFHLKKHPTFVSDAQIKDVRYTIRHLKNETHEETKKLGMRLMGYLETGRLILLDDWFWTSPLEGWRMPEQLKEELTKSDLVISKGDAHYRRLLGDRHWDFKTVHV